MLRQQARQALQTLSSPQAQYSDHQRGPSGYKKSGGLSTISNSIKEGNGYTPVDKFLVVGQNGAGKTQLVFDLAYFVINKYSSVVYICSHFQDKIVVNYARWMKEAGMPFYMISVGEDGSLNVPDVSNSLFIIDDYYTSTGRPKALEALLKQFWNKGRHKGNHIIYIAHTDKYLPHEALLNNSGLFVDMPYEKFPISEFITEPGSAWYMIINCLSPINKKGYTNAELYRIDFTDIPKNEKEIIKKLKSKIPKEDIGKELPDTETYKAIGKQGNELAAAAASTTFGAAAVNKQAKQAKKDAQREKIYGCGRDPSNLPMFGDITCKSVNLKKASKDGSFDYDFSRLVGS